MKMILVGRLLLQVGVGWTWWWFNLRCNSDIMRISKEIMGMECGDRSRMLERSVVLTGGSAVMNMTGAGGIVCSERLGRN